MPLTVERNDDGKPQESTGLAEPQNVREVTQAAGASSDGSTGVAEKMLVREVSTKVIEPEDQGKPSSSGTARTK